MIDNPIHQPSLLFQRFVPMRKDEQGNECPATLGEYRTLCVALGGEECQAVKLLDERIKDQGEAMKVIATDEQMRRLLVPLL
jgi:hypothetical protein